MRCKWTLPLTVLAALVAVPLGAQEKLTDDELPGETRVVPDAIKKLEDAPPPTMPHEKLKLPDMGLLMVDSTWKKMKTGIPRFGIGRWAKYELTHPELNLGTMRISVVPQSSLKNPSARILEFKSHTATGENNYVKLMFVKRSTDPSNMGGVAFKIPNMPPMVLPLDQGAKREKPGGLSFQSAESEQKVKFEGVEKITVPAGTYETWHYVVTGLNARDERYTSHMWFDKDKKVPVFHLVQARTKDTTMQLVGSGQGAKSDLPPFPAAQ